MRIEQIIRISMKQRKEDIMKKISKKQWLALGVLSALSFCGVVGAQAEQPTEGITPINDQQVSQTFYQGNGILQSDGTYKFIKDFTLSTTEPNDAAIETAKKLVIDASGQVLTLKHEYNSGYAEGKAAIHLERNNDPATITAKTLKIIDKNTARDGDKGVENIGIYLKKGLTINGDVDLEVTGIKKSSAVQVDEGNLVVNGKLKAKATFSYFDDAIGSSYGIEVTNNGKVNVTGGVDITARGSALYVEGGTISVSKGGQIISNHAMNQYAIEVNGGEANINVIDNAPGTEKMVINGNVHLYDSGTVKIGLGTKDSTFTGAVWNEGVQHKSGSHQDTNSGGRVEMYLRNGAVWTDTFVGLGKQKSYKGSYIDKFVGGEAMTVDKAGVIIRKAYDPTYIQTLTIGEYSGHTYICYEHNGDGTHSKDYFGNVLGAHEAVESQGGYTNDGLKYLPYNDTVIKKAAPGSSVTLVTNRGSLDITQKDKVHEVLDTLAGKLFYEDYKNNPNNLTGTVTIAEGLTTPSVSLAIEKLKFGEDGRGHAEKEATPPVPSPEDTFTTHTPIFALAMDAKTVKEWLDKGFLNKDGGDPGVEYTIKQNTVVDLRKVGTTPEDEFNVPCIAAIYWSCDHGFVDMTGHSLTLNAAGNSSVERHHIYSENKLVMKNIKELILQGENGSPKNYILIKGKNTGSVDISNGDQDVLLKVENHDEQAKTLITIDANQADNGNATDKTFFRLKGMLESEAKNATLADITNGSVSLDGVKFTTEGDGILSVHVRDGGIFNANSSFVGNALKANEKKHDVIIEGNIFAERKSSGKKGKIGLALNTSNSYFTGLIGVKQGEAHMILKDGAKWNHESKGMAMNDISSSHLKTFTGDKGFIYQNDAKGITIDSYKGNTTVFYAHDNKGTVAADYKGGDIHVKSADAGSSVTLVTDKHDINLNNADEVYQVLNTLAGKFFYDGHAAGSTGAVAESNLKGTVKIAEGLTTPSQEIKVKAMKFKDADGQGYVEKDVVPPKPQQIFQSETFTTDREAHVDVKNIKRGKYDPMAAIFVDPNEQPDGTYLKNISVDLAKHNLKMTMDFNYQSLAQSGRADVQKYARSDLKGIYLGRNKAITFSNVGAKGIEFILTGPKGNEVQAMNANPNIFGIEANQNSQLTIDGDVKMNMVGKQGIEALRLNDFATVTIKGKLSASMVSQRRAERDMTPQGDHDNFKPDTMFLYGIHVANNNNKDKNKRYNVSVKEVDIRGVDVGVETVKGGDVTIGGGTLMTDGSSFYENRLVNNDGGTVNIGMNEAKTDAGTMKTQLVGNVLSEDITLSSGTTYQGIVNIGLRGTESYWKGIVDSYNDKTFGPKRVSGKVNLTLRDGAHWENVRIGARKKMPAGSSPEHDGSFIDKLKADNSTYIYQKDNKPLTINQFEGETSIFFDHEEHGLKAENFKGGDVIIKSAKAGSGVRLVISNKLINTDNKEEVYKVLSLLAKKLVYEGYKDKDGHEGERNLTAGVRIAEGLTTPSKSLKEYPMGFENDTGRGILRRTDVGLINPDTTTKVEAQIIEDNYFGEEVRAMWDKSGHRKAETAKDKVRGIMVTTKANYTFNKDLVLDIANTNKAFVDQAWHKYQFGAIQWAGDPVGNINMNHHKMTLNVYSEDPRISSAGIYVKSGSLTIDNVDGVDITSDASHSQSRGIFVIGMNTSGFWANGRGNAKLVINNDDAKEHAVKIKVKGHEDMGAIEARGNTGTAEIDIKGLVDVESHKFFAIEALQKAKISLGGGIVKSDGNAALKAGSGSVINMNAVLGSDKKVKPVSATRDVQIIGGITSYNKAVTNIALATKNSFFTGMASLDLWGIEDWEDHTRPLRGDLNLYMGEGATWTNEEVGEGANVKGGGGGETPASIVSQIISHGGNIIQKDRRSITIEKLEGEVNLYYGHDGDGTKAEDYTVIDKKDPSGKKKQAGDTHIKSAEQGSKVHLYTDRNGIDIQNNDKVKETLNALAGKLYYDAYKTGTAERNLTGTVGIAEGLTSPAIKKDLADLKFKDENGQGTLDENTFKPMPNPKPPEPPTPPTPKPPEPPTPPQPKPPTPKPTDEAKVVNSTKTAIFSTILTWQAQNNDLQKRLGDLRLAKEESGVWAKYQGGAVELDTKDTKNNPVKWKEKYNGIQAGYDKVVGEWTIGGAFGYMKSDDTYITGTGKGTTINGAIYGSQVKSDGTYIDIIAKVGQVKNDYDVHTEGYKSLSVKDGKFGDRVKGTYKANAVLLSLEYGKRMEQANGFYFEPSAELTMSHIGAYDETVTSLDGKVPMKVHNDAVNSLIGKLGVAAGQKTENMSFYGKLSLAHEFGGEIKGRFEAENYPVDTNIKMEDTWLDLELGGSFKMSESSYIYGTFTKNFGAKMNNKWRLDAGIRFAF